MSDGKPLSQSQAQTSAFTAGPRLTDGPQGDPRRQAIPALRGYAYQLYVSALAWVRLGAGERLFLEVAEDYAIATREGLEAVQVKDTPDSSLTLNSPGVTQTIDAFVDLVARNPGVPVRVRYLTTAPVGLERSLDDRIGGGSALGYWRRAAAAADVTPIRAALLGLSLSPAARDFIGQRDDEALRKDLLRRIHWDAGSADLAGVRQDLEAAILDVGQALGGLTLEDARQASAALIEQVLATVLGEGERALDHRDLKSSLERLTHIWAPRRQIEAILGIAQGAAAGGFARASILRDAAETPPPRLMAPRPELVEDLQRRAVCEGLAFVVGGTGTGKTLLAKLTATAIGEDWAIVDFLDLDADQTAERLQRVRESISESERRGLILDDLDWLDTPAAALQLSRLAAALRRDDRLCIATTYLAPSARLRSELALSPEAVLQVPFLSDAEVYGLVTDAGGDPSRWATLIHLATSMGHPQLVQATIADLQSRGWPDDALASLELFDLSGLDLDAQRDAARRRLFAAAPAGARILLYRSSLLIGTFKRQTAIAVGQAAPPVDMAGDHLDRLVGPWIDRIGRDRLRISPLLSDAGVRNLPANEQQEVHGIAAQQILGSAKLDIEDADSGYLHARISKSEYLLTRFATSVLASDHETIGRLSGWLTTLRVARSDRPIYEDHRHVSLLLRLDQVLLEAEAERPVNLIAKWNALIREIAEDPDDKSRRSFELMALSKALLSRGLSAVPDWPDQLGKLAELFDDPTVLGTFPRLSGEYGKEALGFYFVNLALGVKTVESLRDVFLRLDSLEAPIRSRLLGRIRQNPEEITHLVHTPWVAENRATTLDANLAEAIYAELARLAESWGERDLAIFCVVARGVMFDEYADNESAALEALIAAEVRFGEDPIISRARAKIAYRRARHQEALPLLRELAEGPIKDPVERAFLCREAGICASELKDDADARDWFLLARQASATAKSETMRPMTIGLLVDAALADWRCGRRAEAMASIADAIEEARVIDSDNALKAVYLRKALGQACLWLAGQATFTNYEVDGQPPAVPPGFCSNPEPSEGIRDLPAGSLLGDLYLVAAAEVGSGIDAGIGARLSGALGSRYILTFETSLRLERLYRAIERLDFGAIAAALPGALDAMVLGTQAMTSRTGAEADPLPVVDSAFPMLSAEERQGERAQTFINDAIFAIRLLSEIRQIPGAERRVAALEKTLVAQGYPPAETSPDCRQAAFMSIWLAAQDPSATAEDVIHAGLRMLEWAKFSIFAKVVLPDLGVWGAAAVPRVMEAQRFRLRSPDVSIPAVRSAAAMDAAADGRLRRIVRAALPSIRASLDRSMAELLRD